MSTQHVHIYLDSAAASAAAAALFARLVTPAAPAIITSRTIPKIGTYWDGQGGIYAGASRGWGDVPDGHLIVPTDPRASFKGVKLGTDGTDVTGAKSERDGRSNTVALAEAGSNLCQDILGLEIEGHKDFFLPSRRDSALCFASVPELFETDDWYWLSTQFSAGSAWPQNFSHGDQRDNDKQFAARARACRRLIL